MPVSLKFPRFNNRALAESFRNSVKQRAELSELVPPPSVPANDPQSLFDAYCTSKDATQLIAHADTVIPFLIDEKLPEENTRDIYDNIRSALVAFGETAVPALTEALTHANPNVVDASISVLAKLKEASVPALKNLFAIVDDRTQHAGLRASALTALSEIAPDSSEVFERFKRELKSSKVPEIRLVAVHGLWKLPCERRIDLLPTLIEMLTDQSLRGDLRRYAGELIVSVGKPAVDPLIRSLQLIRPRRSEPILGVLGQLGSDAASVTPKLIELLNSGNAHPRMIKTLGEIAPEGDEVIRALLHAIKKYNLGTCSSVTAALSRFGERAIPTLAEFLSDSNPQVRRVSAYSLAHLSDAAEPALPALIDAMKKEKNSGACAAMIYVLKRLGERAHEAVPVLSNILLEFKDPHIRSMAAEALLEVARFSDAVGENEPYLRRHDICQPLFNSIMRDKDEIVSCRVLEVLAKIVNKDCSAAGPLFLRLTDDSPILRQTAARGLVSCGYVSQDSVDPHMSNLMHPDKEIWRHAGLCIFDAPRLPRRRVAANG